ncbi:hypothetical protein [Aliidiomarina soli]|uniref:Uncharacterized protein n=1 Tax=Aliidiomarina soli TaxID=1928574 RepID=A0A432WHD5_9GAMM|nr:hypothetical protein [Aliidiomarina soli]RUO33165.1 hypothetical protein CWE14_08030 [Aliidiomarina soli]
MSIQLEISRPTQPDQHCVKCRQPHQAGQHRVVHNQQISLFANSTPLFDQPYGTEEVRLTDGWFYLSLHCPVKPVLQTLKAEKLPWLCPHCAGYEGISNLDAPGATILNDNGEQRATGVHHLFDKQRHEQEAAKLV